MPQTGAERMRTYRERKRQAQRCREFRAKQKIQQANHDKVPAISSSTTPTTVENSSEIGSETELNDSFDMWEQQDPVTFNYTCAICDGYFSINDLKKLAPEHKQLIWRAFPGIEMNNRLSCRSCFKFLSRLSIPAPKKFRNRVLWHYMLTKMLFFPKTFIN